MAGGSEKTETIREIVAEMRAHGHDGNFVNGYEVSRLADRIEAASNRMPVPTPEQWTLFARQGSVLQDLMDAVGHFLDSKVAEMIPQEDTAPLCKALYKAICLREESEDKEQ